MLVRDDSFINVQGWMVTRLGLKGIDLLVYACIHGFSHDDGTVFRGSRQYLAEFCGTSLSSIARSLKSLKDRGLIIQTYHSIDNSEVFYKAITDPSVSVTRGVVSEWHDPSVKLTRGVVSKVTEASVKMTRAIKDDNIADKLEHKLVDTIVCSARAREHTRPTEEEVSEIVSELKLDGFNVKKFVSFWNACDWKDKNGRDVSKNLKDRILYWHETEPMIQKRSGNVLKVTEPCRPGYQRDQYGFEFMVNDYDHDHLDGQAANDLLDQLLSEN